MIIGGVRVAHLFYIFVLSYYVSLRSEFVLWCTLRFSVRLYLQLFVGGLMSYLCYLCLVAHSGVQHILCCVFLCSSSSCVTCFPLFFVVLCDLFSFVLRRLVWPVFLCSSSSCVTCFPLFFVVLCDLFSFVLRRLVWPVFLCSSSSCVTCFANFSGLSLRYFLTFIMIIL